MEELYTVKEVSEKIKISEQSLRRWIRDQKINYVKLPNGGYRFTRKQIDLLVKNKTPKKS